MKQDCVVGEMKKSGRGNQSNSSEWTVRYDPAQDLFVAMLQFGSAQGGWMSLYEIPKETFDRAGTFEDDDYKTERLIRKGRLLYKYENERNYPEPVEIIRDPDYEALCSLLLYND